MLEEWMYFAGYLMIAILLFAASILTLFIIIRNEIMRYLESTIVFDKNTLEFISLLEYKNRY